MKKSEALNILGLSDNPTEDEIKKAHRKLIIENHPDKFGQDKAARDAAEEKTKLINEARDVLINKKWDPEYSTTGTPYGAPFSYNPYTNTRPASSGSGRPQSQDPFDIFSEWPFTQTSFVWTTWDPVSGKKTTYTSAQNPFSASGASQTKQNASTSRTSTDPFAGRTRSQNMGNPFSNSFISSLFGIPFYQDPPSIDEQIKDAKSLLGRDLKLIVVKLAILVLCFLFGFQAAGLYLYTIISIGQGIYKRARILSIFILAPFALLSLIFAPLADGPVRVIGLVCFALAFIFDISNIVQHAKLLNMLTKQKKKASEN